jgi:diadenosine tetraphosphate (Ap4A) HIT family hydrolase
MILPPSLADWELDPLLERDTTPVGDMPLSRVLLIKDSTYPWLLLVPRRHLAVEITDLDMIEQAQLMSEIAHASHTLKALTGCDKINVAALGNVVSQLHVHIIARSRGDAAWPRPVWNAVPPRDYDKAALDKLLAALRQRLTLTPL